MFILPPTSPGSQSLSPYCYVIESRPFRRGCVAHVQDFKFTNVAMERLLAHIRQAQGGKLTSSPVEASNPTSLLAASLLGCLLAFMLCCDMGMWVAMAHGPLPVAHASSHGLLPRNYCVTVWNKYTVCCYYEYIQRYAMSLVMGVVAIKLC